MTDYTVTEGSDLTAMTADIVSAYLTKNRVEPSQVADLIVSVHQSLVGLGNEPVEQVEEAPLKTRAEIKKSITGTHLISFLDGKPYRSLRRHLNANGLTPDAYKARFGLPNDYPMVSPSYSAERSALAKSMGLGSGGRGRKPQAKLSATNNPKVARAAKKS